MTLISVHELKHINSWFVTLFFKSEKIFQWIMPVTKVNSVTRIQLDSLPHYSFKSCHFYLICSSVLGVDDKKFTNNGANISQKSLHVSTLMISLDFIETLSLSADAMDMLVNLNDGSELKLSVSIKPKLRQAGRGQTPELYPTWEKNL